MEKKEHPSYGMLQLSRSSIGGNGTALFGSSIMHNDVIRLTISNGFMEREDSQDRYYVKTSRKNCIVEVDMSYTQFAEAITSLNIGCIGCPMAGKKRWREFARYPKYKEAYIRAFAKMLEYRKACGNREVAGWKTPEGVFKRWMEDQIMEGQMSMVIEGNVITGFREKG